MLITSNSPSVRLTKSWKSLNSLLSIIFSFAILARNCIILASPLALIFMIGSTNIAAFLMIIKTSSVSLYSSVIYFTPRILAYSETYNHFPLYRISVQSQFFCNLLFLFLTDISFLL